MKTKWTIKFLMIYQTAEETQEVKLQTSAKLDCCMLYWIYFYKDKA